MMKNDKNNTAKKPGKTTTSSEGDLSKKLQELEVQKEKLEETLIAREEQLLNLFSYIQTSAK